ncbi:unnamed protein product [Penicillium glandicola]
MSLVTSKASELQALQKRNDDRLAQQGSGSAATAFAKDVKQSLLFQYDWGELLSAAPMCLSLMGACYVASSSPKAVGMTLEDCKPTGGFKHIRHPELRACLIQVSDYGRMAFLEAEKKMALIGMASGSIGETLPTVSQYLALLPARDAEMALNKKLNLIKDQSDNCLQYAKDIEAKFVEWLLLVCEVHQVTVAKEERTSIDQVKNSITLAGVEIEASLTENSVKHAEEAANTMKENMVQSRDMFRKAADAIPTPMEQVGIQLVSSLAQSVTTVVSQGLPMMMGRMLGGTPAAAPGVGNKQKRAKGYQGGQKAGSLSQSNISVPDANDPGYQAAVSSKEPINLLAAILGIGTDKGVDWEKFSSTAVNAKGGVTFIDTMISHTLKSTQWTDGLASTELKESLEKLHAVVAAVKAEAAKDQSLMAKKESSTSTVVKGWQNTTETAKASVLKLAATASSLPGSAPGSAPFMGKIPTAAPGGDDSAMNAALQSAQEKLNVTEAAYTASQANYQKAVETRSRVEQELAKIKGNLKNLQLQQAQMEEIKKVLIQCIAALIQMKAQITNLVRFFSALSVMIEHVVKHNVREFLDNVDTAKTCLIGNISLSDMTRQDLYTTTLMLQAYFSLFNSISSMYIKISKDHVMPGLNLCDKLSMSTSDPNAMDERMRMLDEFTDNAQAAVRQLVKKEQDSITKSLDDRVNLVKRDTQLLPALPANVQQAITDGKETITNAVSDGMDSFVNPVAATDYKVSMDDL